MAEHHHFDFTKIAERIPPQDTTSSWPPGSGNPTAALLLSTPDVELAARKKLGGWEGKSVEGMSGVLQGVGKEREREKAAPGIFLQG